VGRLAHLSRSVRVLADLNDGPMDPSPRVMNRGIYIYSDEWV
jgi:hypothetical protein